MFQSSKLSGYVTTITLNLSTGCCRKEKKWSGSARRVYNIDHDRLDRIFFFFFSPDRSNIEFDGACYSNEITFWIDKYIRVRTSMYIIACFSRCMSLFPDRLRGKHRFTEIELVSGNNEMGVTSSPWNEFCECFQLYFEGLEQFSIGFPWGERDKFLSSPPISYKYIEYSYLFISVWIRNSSFAGNGTKKKELYINSTI